MTMPLAYGRCLLAAMAILMMAAAATPAAAQQRNSDGSPNPTASVVDQKTLLREFPRIDGRIDIPDPRAAVLIQPAGRMFQRFHEVILHWFGAIVIVGMIAAAGDRLSGHGADPDDGRPFRASRSFASRASSVSRIGSTRRPS